MNSSIRSRLRPAIVLIAAFAFVSGTTAQAQGGAPGPVANRPSVFRTFSVPRNLKVLPKELSGQQVHDLMEKWATSLGVRCDSCHAEATETLVADDNSQLNYADDSKEMKAAARLMYTMTEKLNRNYIAKLEGSGSPVTCGTCHRGRIAPEPFVAQPPAEMPVELATHQ